MERANDDADVKPGQNNKSIANSRATPAMISSSPVNLLRSMTAPWLAALKTPRYPRI
jgi:hypothetical protein